MKHMWKRFGEKKSGFTLIEIMLVTALLGIFATIVIGGLGRARSSGRDARRFRDLSEIQKGLELFFARNGNYPASGNLAALTLAGGSNPAFISTVPQDPNGGSYLYVNTGPSTGGQNGIDCATRAGYHLGASMENPTAKGANRAWCGTLGAIGDFDGHPNSGGPNPTPNGVCAQTTTGPGAQGLSPTDLCYDIAR